MPQKIIVISQKDNVATALQDLKKGDSLQIQTGDNVIDIILLEDIPFGHKLALYDIPQGASVIKYGEVVGMATSSIKKGQLVHVHNVGGTRGRGDIQ